MRFKSIRTKLVVTVGLCCVVIISGLVVYTSLTARDDAMAAARQQALSLAANHAGRVKAEIEVALDTAQAIAQAFSVVGDADSPLDIGRDPANNILRTILKKNETFASAYMVWEPNAFDDLDGAYANLSGYNETGRFVRDYHREPDGSIVLQLHENSQSDVIKQYYELCRKSLGEIVGEPTFSGHTEITIPVIVPIVYDRKFLGVVGIDIPLTAMQELVTSGSISGGHVQVNIVSHSGQLAAVSDDTSLIGQHIRKLHADWQEDLQYIQQGREIIEADEGRFAAFSPIQIGKTSTPWSVNVNISREVMMAEAISRTWLTITIGLVLSLLCLVIVYTLVNRTIRPLRMLTGIAGQVALGNLDHNRIEVSDDEIGEVARSFEQVVASFREVSEVCEAVSRGTFDKTVNIRSDQDVLGKSVNAMAQTLQAVVSQANAVANGDYSSEIVPISDADELGNALSNMTRRLATTTAENQRENWLKTGQAVLNKQMTGQQSTTELAQNVITQVSTYIDAVMGAIYLTDSDGILKMVGSYAYARRKGLAQGFRFGQGLVGQVALEKRLIHVTDLPEDYVAVQSGLGARIPTNVLVVPFIFEGDVIGVMELGSFAEIDDAKLEFVKCAAENIAVAVDSAQSRTKTEELLLETQRQSETLEDQQQKLKATNERLEQQAERLQRSEESLKNQQEQLESTNAELEEKTATLEEQTQQLQQSWNQIKGKTSELELANKYKSEFLSNMSHELRTPLNSLLILAKMLMENEQGNLTDDQVESAKVIHEGGSELLSLINEILDLSKIEAGKMELVLEDVNLSGMRGDIERNFRHFAREKSVEFSVSADDSLPTIRTDVKRVNQIIKNFLSNSFKFTESGSVKVDITRPGPDTQFNNSALNRDTAIAIAVSDTGIGIPLDKQHFVMEAFRQVDGATNRIYGGTGLGLSISTKLAGLLGGEIQLSSEPGKGATFTLLLPEVIANEQAAERQTACNDTQISRCQAPEPAEQTTDLAIEAIVATPQVDDDRNSIAEDDTVVLIIEDDPAFSDILAGMARRRDFKCLIARDGQTGLQMANVHRPAAIILDITLPDIDGMKVMDILKNNSNTRHIPIHFISGRDEPEGIAEAFSKGAIGYLTKPVSKETLSEAFDGIRQFVDKDIHKLLVVESCDQRRDSVLQLIGSEDIEIKAVSTGEEAHRLLSTEHFDCMVLDPGLSDMPGHELLGRIRNDKAVAVKPPVIIYSADNISEEAQIEFDAYTGTAVIKKADSPERLLDETSLFLHRVETSLPAEKQRMIQMIHDKDSVLNGKKVVVVDDDIRNLFALTHALKSHGMVVLRANNGAEALERLAENPDTDIVLMDIMMPIMDGYEAIRKIREQERFWKLPVLALTAKAMQGDRRKCIDAGANDYIAKPIDIDKVMSMLRVWLYL